MKKQTNKAASFILDNIVAGNIGHATMGDNGLYGEFSVKTINSAIRYLVSAGKVKISTPSTGYPLTSVTEYGFKATLRHKDYSISLA